MTAPTKETTVSAPGKLFLIGEYAVLDGHCAVLTAVDRRVVAQVVPGATPATPLVAEVVEAVRAYLVDDGCAVPDGVPVLDSSALASAAGKLGLGSSAAVAAAGVGALLEAAGCDVEYTQALTFTLADRAHRAAQGGRGSGADVAAAVHGGVIYYARRGNGADVQPLDLPEGIELIVFSSGTPSSTVDHVRALRAYGDQQPDACRARLAALGAIAASFTVACADDDARQVVGSVRQASAQLAALGAEIGMSIVTPAFAAAATLAEELGGAAKPSGAGGGDVGVAFMTDRAAAATFRERAPHIGLEILSIGTGASGLRREPSASERKYVEG